nr:MAG TPA: hypothetical protein [Caudoviricetes sp.]
MQIDKIKIPTSYDGQPGKVLSLFAPYVIIVGRYDLISAANLDYNFVSGRVLLRVIPGGVQPGFGVIAFTIVFHRDNLHIILSPCSLPIL